MLSKGIKILLTFSILFISIGVIAQSGLSQAEVNEELSKRGLNEQEVKNAMIAEGLNPDNIANFTPDEILKLEAIILDLESKQNSANDSSGTSNSTEEGVTIDEIDEVEPIEDKVVEEVEKEFVENEKLPPSKIYGQQVFRNKTIKVYQQSEEIKAPDYYILGAGDEIGISIWGRSQIDQEFTVSKDGYIQILSGAKRVLLKGLSLEQAREKLRKVFSNYYSFERGQFEITLNYSRTIQVSVYGDVINPGPITLPALNTAFSALVAVNGPNDIGSIRKIKLIKNNGDIKFIDVYEYMNDPSISSNYYLEEADIIVVPVVEKVVQINGAVNRPLKYELLPNENLRELVDFAGGLKENAFTKTIQIVRFDQDRQKVIDVSYNDFVSGRKKFELKNGDVINIKSIEIDVQNYVNISGEVINGGKFERFQGMRISDLLKLAGLKEQSKTDAAFLIRKNADLTSTYSKINIDEILKNQNGAIDLVLQDKDALTIWAKSRFVDQMSISVDGAIRVPSEYSFDAGEQVRISDLITLAGGLRRDASMKAIIERVDPLRNKTAIYARIDLENIIDNENHPDNVILSPFDKLHIYSENDFLEESYVEVRGAVSGEGRFKYGKNMMLKDALLLAGGFKFGAALNKVEISRIVFKDNEPTSTIIANLELDSDFNIIQSDNPNFSLQPYDAVLVRFVPDFELQKFVVLEGEVVYPGLYPIISPNEKISSIIDRAGGLTTEGFPEGATLIRQKDGIGKVVIRLDEIVKNSSSKFNFTVQQGDKLFIPKQKEFVRIIGATKVKEVLSGQEVGPENEINVPYHPGKDAKFYIDEYAGGIAENGQKSSVFVEHPNGQIEKSKWKLFYRKYPNVTKGSTIKVGFKPPDTNKNNENKEPIDWGKILTDSVAQATTVLTLILLVQRLD